MSRTIKLAKEIAVGDTVELDKVGLAKVLSIVKSVQTVRRDVLLFTIEREDGSTLHRTFSENASIRTPASSSPPPQWRT